MQTYARQHKLPLDVMKFRTDVTAKSVEQVTEAAPVGCYIHGEQPKAVQSLSCVERKSQMYTP